MFGLIGAFAHGGLQGQARQHGEGQKKNRGRCQ